MADDNAIIEGSVKFREGNKWKSRWCVMRRLSPVADCVQLQVYAEARARRAAGMGIGISGGGGGCKAALSLEQFVGIESGFTLDRQSHTLALLCRDAVALLAFESRERLLTWAAKAKGALGDSRQRLVLVAAAPRSKVKGPARLHVRADRAAPMAALTAGLPPRLVGLWELRHLRRFGVVEGRFCFEGGAACGKGEGLHVLVTDQAHEIAQEFEAAVRGQLSPLGRRASLARRSEAGGSPVASRPETRQSLRPSELRLTARRGSRDGDAASLRGATPSPWGVGGGAGDVGAALERCVSCMSKLGALSRSSTAALTPGARHFSPAWTMDALGESTPDAHTPDGVAPKRRIPASQSSPACAFLEGALRVGVGPYENYDVPRVPSTEVEGEYYDTPRRLRECLDSELFEITTSSTADAVILKKPCGCLLRVGRRNAEPTVVETEESFRPADCPCQKVTDWANAWIKLPYCSKREADTSDEVVPNKENVTPNGEDGGALYATVDVTRKTRRKTWCERRGALANRPAPEADRGPLAHYENLSFALSLEHYENAKDLLRKAGVTQVELEAICARLKPTSFGATGDSVCTRCRQTPHCSADEYLMMEPKHLGESEPATHKSQPPAGYTPMSPIGGFAFHTLRNLRCAPGRSPEEKSASNPTLCAGDSREAAAQSTVRQEARVQYRKRSSSADSSRFLEDVEEFEGSGGSVGSRASQSSMETLRGAAGAGCGCVQRRGEEPTSATHCAAPAPVSGGNRDSSSSNDSGVSSCSLRPTPADFELPATTAAARRHWRLARKDDLITGQACRRARSLGPSAAPHDCLPAKSASAEAEVPVLLAKPLTGGMCGTVADTHSTSSGASDMSDYVETLSLCSSHSSSDAPVTTRTCLLRPRSGREYLRLPPASAPPRPPRPAPALTQPP